MTIYGIPILEIEWTVWWLLGSATLMFVGFAGWQVGKFFVGAKIIVDRDDTAPKYNWVREKILAGYLVNQPFKRNIARRQLQSGIGRFFFNLMLLGLVVHIGFWVYAANFMNS